MFSLSGRYVFQICQEIKRIHWQRVRKIAWAQALKGAFFGLVRDIHWNFGVLLGKGKGFVRYETGL